MFKIDRKRDIDFNIRIKRVFFLVIRLFGALFHKLINVDIG